MSDIEAQAQAPDLDYAYAPVGLFVCSFWIGSLLVGLIAFAFNCLAAAGHAPHIVDGQRSWFLNDVDGVMDGVVVISLLLVLSIVLGFVGRAATLRSKNIDGLWKLSWYAIPALAGIVAVASVFVHP